MTGKRIWGARILLSTVFLALALVIYPQGKLNPHYEPVELPTAEDIVSAPPELQKPINTIPNTMPAEYPIPLEPVSYAGCRLPILMYHHIVPNGEKCNEMTITAARLEKDLQCLTDGGYHTVLPQELAMGEALPDKPILITFDDGYRSNYELAYPLLQKYRAKAVISIMTCMQDFGASAFLSWDMCREMAESGLIEIGSHTHSLHNLDDRGGKYTPHGINGIQRKLGESDREFQARVLDDIRESYHQIEEKLGRKATFFAYPYGVVEPDAESLIDELFPVTVVTKRGIADLTAGLQNMPRWTMTMKTEMSRVLA